MNQAGHAPLDVVAMDKYVAELQGLLQSATFQESKAFLASFVRRVEFDKQQVRIEYTVPVTTASGLTDTTEVRCIGSAGTPGRHQCLVSLGPSSTHVVRTFWHFSYAIAIIPSLDISSCIT